MQLGRRPTDSWHAALAHRPSELDKTNYRWSSFGRAPPSRTVYGRLFLHVTKAFSGRPVRDVDTSLETRVLPLLSEIAIQRRYRIQQECQHSQNCDIHRCFDKPLLSGWCADIHSRIEETDRLYQTNQFDSIIGLDQKILPKIS